MMVRSRWPQSREDDRLTRFDDTTDSSRRPVTVVDAEAGGVASSGFPTDLFEEARGRLRLLAGFFAFAFGFDLFAFVVSWLFAGGHPRAPALSALRGTGFQWINLAATLLSIGLAWAAGSPRISSARLHALGLGYEVVVSFLVAWLTFWQFWLDHGILPQLTWVPAIVIMFPLVLPGPPRRMLAAAIASAATSPAALLLLDVTGRVDATGETYVPAVVSPAFAVVFAYLGARVIYGLGREVAAARRMGSYQLEEKLGAGGMGEVWRARHRLLARPAAIKLIRDGTASPHARLRFEREAQAIAGLRSPHTVDLFDFGVADDGSFYYAMELLEGLDADDLVRRFGPVPAERAVFLLRQVCHSLSEAQSRGLVHRDVKPANLFLCRYGEECDFVKVLDFGIVRASEEPGDGTALTGEHSIRGTPAFMAPEQALGRAAVDGRADLYSLGCVAYWLLTGKLVFTADTPTALLVQHVQATPKPPSAVTELPIPAALEEIVLACLAKDPADRPASARDLSRRLDAVEGAHSWTEERRREWWDRHRPVRS